jgi:hypothetical protein
MEEIKQAIAYLQPIADSATVGHYGEMLGVALTALREKADRENPKPQTNADRIRNMSDEELAAFIDSIQTRSQNSPMTDTREYILNWLQQEATE